MPQSISEMIAEAEDKASAAMDAASTLEAQLAIWSKMEQATGTLRELSRLREPGIDEDCSIAGCGSYGRSIV